MQVAHSGKLGDIIWSLPALITMGGKYDLRLYYDPKIGMKQCHASPLLPLISVQPCIQSVQWVDHLDDSFKLDLSRFRQAVDWKGTIPEMILDWLKLRPWPNERPWLVVPSPRRASSVVFARTNRYRNVAFPWPDVYRTYGDRAIFLGDPKEHEDFENLIGPVRYEHTADLLEAARIIAAADIFVGNQSSLATIAESLKVPSIVETPLRGDVSRFLRPHLWNILDPTDQLPTGYGLPDPVEKRVISFVLWGGRKDMAVGAMENARLANQWYPGWTCRFHLERGHHLASELVGMGCEVVEVDMVLNKNHSYCWSNLIHRLAPLADHSVDRVLFRDVDSRLSSRESRAVDEWIKSGRPIHLMHDSPAHRNQVLGGMWGCESKLFRDYWRDWKWWWTRNYVANTKKENEVDERFLNEYVYQPRPQQCLFHGTKGKPFPCHEPMPIGCKFVGDRVSIRGAS